MAWTDERIELLKKLWSDGFSCSQIAAQIGGITRNAVIGKVHRMGMAGRATTRKLRSFYQHKRSARSRVKPRRDRQRSPVIQKLMAEPYVPRIEPDIPPDQRIALVDLEPHSCRWPIGDPQEADFGFCGRNKLPGLPYCEPHARLAYDALQPAKPKKPRPASVFQLRARIVETVQ